MKWIPEPVVFFAEQKDTPEPLTNYAGRYKAQYMTEMVPE